MTDLNCSACEELRQTAPDFVVNGITDDICASLSNGTGLNPSNENDNCTDLSNINDCLIGNMAEEVNAYDVCDWKEFMKNFIPNLWTTLKAIICALCGIWNHVSGVQQQLEDMCALIEATNQHPVQRFGTLENSMGDNHPERRGGVIGTKGGQQMVLPRAQSDVSVPAWNGQNAGLNYGRLETTGCSDETCKLYEWIAPSFVAYKFNPNVTYEYDDVLWYVTKQTAMEWGISEALWDGFEESSWTWHDYVANHGLVQLNLHAEDDRLKIKFRGTIPSGVNVAGAAIGMPENPDKLYIHNC